MASLRIIRRRIRSVKNTSQITKAMQMVAASKMKRAQQLALAGHPYVGQMNKMLASLMDAVNVDESLSPLLAKRENKTPGVLLISTDKGLCGPLNSNLFKLAMEFPKETKFVVIGKKGSQFLSRTKRNLVADFPIKDNSDASQIKKASQFLIDLFLKGEIDSVNVIYSSFVNTLIQKAIVQTILPIANVDQIRAGQSTGKTDQHKHATPSVLEYLFEPDPHHVLEKLLPYYVDYEIYSMVLDARASEHSARMVAMKSATDNAKEIVNDLTLQYNRVRQDEITKQILEISTAQMALTG